MMNILNGGAHSDAPIDFQEFMIVPKEFSTFSEALRAGTEIFHALKAELKNADFPPPSVTKVDLLLLFPPLRTPWNPSPKPSKPLDTNSAKTSSSLSIAPRASSTTPPKILRLQKSDGSKRNADELVAYYQGLCAKYPIISIEDGCAENDWVGWKKLTDALGSTTQLVGDDLFVTNVDFLQKGINQGVANSILVKVNQIGTLTETLDAIELAKENRYTAVISHRSGETEDVTIADIAVATNAGQIKTGSLCRTDRVAKYNQLLRIEEELGDNAIFGGKMR